jgi:hypothetical protein
MFLVSTVPFKSIENASVSDAGVEGVVSRIEPSDGAATSHPDRAIKQIEKRAEV